MSAASTTDAPLLLNDHEWSSLLAHQNTTTLGSIEQEILHFDVGYSHVAAQYDSDQGQHMIRDALRGDRFRDLRERMQPLVVRLRAWTSASNMRLRLVVSLIDDFLFRAGCSWDKFLCLSLLMTFLPDQIRRMAVWYFLVLEAKYLQDSLTRASIDYRRHLTRIFPHLLCAYRGPMEELRIERMWNEFFSYPPERGVLALLFPVDRKFSPGWSVDLAVEAAWDAMIDDLAAERDAANMATLVPEELPKEPIIRVPSRATAHQRAQHAHWRTRVEAFDLGTGMGRDLDLLAASYLDASRTFQDGSSKADENQMRD